MLHLPMAFAIALSIGLASSSAAILSVTGNDTLVGSRPANLITNGSFEDDDGVAANGSYWATGTSLTPTMSISGWTASGQSNSYAFWGNDGSGGIKFSDLLAHGSNGVYFGGGIMASVTPLPVEANNGLVTFASPPVIMPKPSDGPVTLQQTVSGLNPSASYLLDFWTSGESVGPFGPAMDGFFGLNITGEPTLYFAAPSGNGPIGLSQRYQVYFTPTASTVTFEWVNWGHYQDTNGMSDELVLDDVILNLVSNVPTPLDCSCLTNVILTCPAVVPDLCAMFSSCFTTNMLPGSCTQSFPPGMPLSVGTYPLQLQVMDLQSNIFACVVTIDVLPPDPATPLTLSCPTNKTVECGSNWSFDPPSVLSSCCGVNITWSDVVVSNSPCDIQYTRTWQVTDGCNNVKSCSQTVTTVDTTPPGPPCNGQNMVLNGSFEFVTNCPNAISQFDFAAPWFTPTAATTDLYSGCGGSSGGPVTAPTNLAGIHPPVSGNNYAGAAIFSTYGTTATNSYREYLEVPLVTALTPGQQYQVSFYVRRSGIWGHAIADIGARFLPLAYTDYGTSNNTFYGVLPFSAQIENPTNNIITSTNSWTLIQGVYTAIGWETHLVLGNFKDDPSTTSTFVGGDFNDYAYYLFDDVSVVAVCNSNMLNQVVQCGQPFSLDPFPIVDNCSGSNITVSSVTTTSGVCPQVITRLWTVADQCGNLDTLTQTVTIVDTNPPVPICGSGVNLVPNAQFENYANCPYFFGQVPTAAPWFNPTVATPDYLNTCATFAPVGIPNNWFGSQTPFSGNGYMGAFAYSVYGTNPVPGYREYIEAPLLAPLQGGVTYQVSFRVSLADSSGWAIAELGAHFSTGPVTDGSTQGPLIVIPQVENPAANLLTSKSGWMQVSGTYTATGGEDHITLGNFRSDANTTAVTSTGTNHTYYYYDDIVVTPLCAITNKTVICGQPWTFDEPVGLDDCSGTNVLVTVTSTTTNGGCPQVITRTWTLEDACGNTNTVSQSVTNLDNTPPVLLCLGNNLVPNSQFEFIPICPTGFSELYLAYPWLTASDATPDYYNTCALTNLVGVPVNYFGDQAPYSGQGYAGAYVYASNGETDPLACYREYLQVQFNTPLVAAQVYPVSFRVSPGDFAGRTIAELGAHFSVGSISNGIVGVLNAVPQVVNPSSNILSDTNGWTLISGFYTATGGETHLTLGNFLTDAATTAAPILVNATNQANPLNDTAYYYYEDVYVGGPCTILTNVMLPCGTDWSFPEVVAYDACGGTNVTLFISTVTNTICPLSITRTWTAIDTCNNTNVTSQTINIGDFEPPIPFCITGTNLVPNESFESYTNCPDGLSQTFFAVPWYPPTQGTPDLLSACAGTNYVGVPNNFVGSQMPFTGQSYVGLYAYSLNGDTNPANSYREYLQVPLTAPLVANQAYTVSFRTSLADNSGWAVANLGAHLSVGAITNPTYTGVLTVTPQVQNSPSNVLTSTTGWMLIQGTFVATGGETHLTIGSFTTDVASTVLPAGGQEAGLAYYYLDEVRVEGACGNNPEIVVPCGTPWSFPVVTGYDLCSGTNFSTVITTVTNSECPLQITRTWTLTDPCGNSTNVTQMIIVTDNQPPVVNCDCLQDEALSLLSTNGCTGVIPSFAALSNSPCISDNCGPIQIFQSPAAGTVVGPGTHPISVTIADCGGNGTNCVFLFTVNGTVATLLTPPTIYALTCSNSIPVSFSVTASNNVGPVVCTPPSGSLFPLGTNTVTCIATNPCGGTLTNTFKVVVRSARVNKWSCLTMVIGIPIEIGFPGGGGGSGSAARVVILPDLPDGGHAALFDNLGSSGQDGVRFDFGAAQEFSFTTELDFNAPLGARFDLVIPPGAGQPTGTPLLSFERSATLHDGWHVRRYLPAGELPTTLHRSTGIGTNGELFSSFTQDAATLDTNILATIAPMNGVTNATLNVTVDCLTHAVSLGFPHGEWMPDAGRKGWDGCIYGPDRPPKKKNTAARLILTPVNPVLPPPITNLDLVFSNLVQWPIYNPTITSMGRKWGDGHVTLMKAYDDGSEEGMDFFSLGEGGGIAAEIGHAATFSFRMERFHNGDIPDQQELYRTIGWPPGTTTNRPAPPTNYWRLTPTGLGSGLPPTVEVAADFTEWGVSNVTVQLWNSGSLVDETNLPANLATSLVTLDSLPDIMGSPGIGVLSLGRSSGTMSVVLGLACTSGSCDGDELRIIADLPTTGTPPVIAYTGLEVVIGDGMDLRLSELQTTPACSPAPITVNRTTGGVIITWEADGFRLQGAETLAGPWHDLGVSSPVTLPANSSLRVFRLLCD